MTIDKNLCSEKIAFLVLAAGGSKRMGATKQLLEWQGKSFINHAVDKAIASCPCNVFVVVGANKEAVVKEIGTRKLQIIVNPDWEKGQGSSIATGVGFIRSYSSLYLGVLISLADQPLISLSHYNRLISSFKNGDKSIIATKHGEHVGVPAIFGEPYFDLLEELSGAKGAKGIIKNNSSDTGFIEIEHDKYVDIDTPDDFMALHRKI